MTGLLCALALVGWLAGIVLMAASVTSLLADEPLPRLAAERMPVAVALFFAVVIVFWPAAVVARTLDTLVKRERP
ncbi:hypothetical protein JHN59_10650 [Streptomyces sp. MBT49]|uniref:hypothetical protein n=1 Tax=unclassified Streptomyces TaxID=2593676 RepID=UPI00190B77AB|nr:hypothetical protein [Streptomyces sp. MBT49]MBK3625298.1 hypothetical protein [Streptomyces sp. MBT49]